MVMALADSLERRHIFEADLIVLNDLSSKVLFSLIILVFPLTVLVSSYGFGEEFYSVSDVEVTVYGDGSAHLRYVVQVNSTVPSISLPLPKDASDVMVTDGSGRLVHCEQVEDSLTVYSLGEVEVFLEYDTYTLTWKDGSIWTLRLHLPAQGKILLPEGATVIYLSDLPASIEAKGGRPVLGLSRGSWEVSYVLSLHRNGGESSRTQPTSQTTFPYPIQEYAPVIAVGVVVTILLFYLRRRVQLTPGGLSSTDVEVLSLVRSRGGRIFMSELRESLGLPKTTVWRRVRRLEGMGYVRTRKVGSQVEVEIV
ncbi:MAG: winged helix-turn-helix transcriptional regulator [Candidatus Bathyarchaeia archaeon]